MSEWLAYDDFVDRIRSRHLEAFSGLLIGVSDRQHSFQVGFERGEIVLLTYRVRKGMEALRLITQVERARIAEHPADEIPAGRDGTIDTSAVIEALVAGTADDTTTITRIDESAPSTDETDLTIPGLLDTGMRKAIESAALHHFGPIGALLCEEQLDNPEGDVKTIIFSIAREIGASEDDTRAFFRSVAEA